MYAIRVILAVGFPVVAVCLGVLLHRIEPSWPNTAWAIRVIAISVAVVAAAGWLMLQMQRRARRAR